MNCEEFSQSLDQLKAGDVPKEQLLLLQEQMKTHSAVCSSCQMLWDLHTLNEGQEAPQNLHQMWMDNIKNKQMSTQTQGKIIPFQTKIKRVLSMASVFVFLLLGASFVQKNEQNFSLNHAPSQANIAEYAQDEYEQSPMMARSAPQGANSFSDTEKVIKETSLTIKTQAFDADIAFLTDLFTKYNAQIHNKYESQNGTQKDRFSDYTISVKSADLEAFLVDVQGVKGQITSLNQSAIDQTGMYTDTEGRLKTQQDKLLRLHELLKKADNVSDLIEIENAISNTQYEVERYTQQLSDVDKNVENASVRLSIREESALDITTSDNASFLDRIKTGVLYSLQNLYAFVQNVGVFIVMAAPWLFILFVLLCILITIVKKRRK